MSSAREVVLGYFAAWTKNDVPGAEAFLADDLAFWGPTASYTSAAQFHPALAGFAAMTKAARVVELVADGDRVALLYDCDLPPVGTLKIASFFWVSDGKIKRYETMFDASELRKLIAARG